MTNQQTKNRLQKRLESRRFWFVAVHVTAIFFISAATLFASPEKAKAATLYQQTTHDTDISGNISVLGYYYTMDFLQPFDEIESIKVRLRVVSGGSSITIGLICYDDAAFTSLNTGCSWNASANPDATMTPTFVTPNSSDVEYTFTPTVPFVISTGKYYRIQFRCVSGCGGGDDVEVRGQSGPPIGIPYYVIDGTSGVPPITLQDVSTVATNESGSLLLVGEDAAFFSEWNPTFTPYILAFYEDIESIDPVILFEDQPQPALNTRLFTYKYQYPGVFRPIAAIGNEFCTSVSSGGTLTGSGCLVEYSDGETFVTIETPQQRAQRLDVTYESVFNFSKTRSIVVGESVSYNYDLSSNFCPDSTVTGKRIFKGYYSNLAHLDSGTVLPSGNSGSGTIIFDRTNMPYSSFFYPYIHIYCANGSYHDVYRGGTTTPSFANGVSVVEVDDFSFWVPDSWLAGGGSDNFGAGTGYYMASDKRVYMRNDEVKFKWQFNTDFTVGSVAFFPNDGEDVAEIFTESEDIEEGQYHYYGYSYDTPGEKQPYIEVRSTTYSSGSSLTYRRVFLKGGIVPDPYEFIMITNQSPVFSGETGTGSGLGKGIFGLDAWSFDSFASTGNPYIDEAISLLRYPFMGLKWLSTFLYSSLTTVPPFSLVDEILLPVEGTEYTTPKYILGQDITEFVPQQTFIIDYAPSERAPLMNTLFTAMVAGSIFWYMMDHYFLNKK